MCFQYSSLQSLSCVWLFVTPKDCSMPGLPVHHQLPELTQTHVHRVSDAIQPPSSPHPLSSPSPPAFNLSQHQGLSQWVSSSHQVARSFGASASASVLSNNIFHSVINILVSVGFSTPKVRNNVCLLLWPCLMTCEGS